MSAYVVGKEHIDYIVAAAQMQGYYAGCSAVEWAYGTERQMNPRTNADAIGRALWAENVASALYRYPDCTPDHLPGPIGIDHESVGCYRFRRPLGTSAVQALKAIQCYEYQSCEHPGWQTSDAKAFCLSLTKRLIAYLPGYDDAQWEITDTR